MLLMNDSMANASRIMLNILSLAVTFVVEFKMRQLSLQVFTWLSCNWRNLRHTWMQTCRNTVSELNMNILLCIDIWKKSLVCNKTIFIFGWKIPLKKERRVTPQQISLSPPLWHLVSAGCCCSVVFLLLQPGGEGETNVRSSRDPAQWSRSFMSARLLNTLV